MKVLLVNGSINEFGCTNEALTVIKNRLKENDVDSEIVWIGDGPVDDYNGKHHESDIVNVIGEKMKESDAIIVGSPTWYSHPTGRLMCVLDRLSTEYGVYLAYKPASSIMSARRAGQVLANDIITKHFALNNMPIVTSTYWNLIFGSKPEDIYKDEEGIATMNNLADNMAWLLKSIKTANIVHPKATKVRTNFHK